MSPVATANHATRRILAHATAEREVGGKACNLARLIALGVPVPDGAVLTTAAFHSFMRADGLGERIDRLEKDVAHTDHERRRGTAARIRSLVLDAAMPADVNDALEAIADVMVPTPHTPLAVRSSAVGEDSASASFAGQLDSVLHVTTRDALRRAVRVCWASYWSERVLFYRAARGVSLAGMGVLIQRQVAARFSGVVFTLAPDGTADLVIEYCEGLGDALVSGRVDPGRVIVSRGGLSIRSHLPPAAQTDPARVLTEPQVQELSRRGVDLERAFGTPQDIEWSIDEEGRLWILQSRPITTPAPASAAAPAAPRSVRWSNANVSENFPRPISPLLYSIASLGYYHYFRNLGLAFGVSRSRLRAMERPLRSIIGVHGARMYYNLTSIHAVLRMAPFGDRLTAAFNQFTGVSETAAQPPGASAWKDPRSRVGQVVEALRIAVQTTWQFLFLRRRVAAFEATATAFAARTTADAVAARPLPRLVEDLHAFVDIRCHHWKNASLADTAAMVAYALLQRALKSAGAAGTMHNRLLRALPGVPSSIPPLRLWHLSRQIRSDEALRRLFAEAAASDVLVAIGREDRFAGFRQGFEQFLEEWGFRSSLELMLTLPSLQEDPLPAIALLARYAESDDEPPDAAIARQASARLAETSRLLRSLIVRCPHVAAAVWVALKWTQRGVSYRERARLKQALLYTRCRRVALAIGDRLAASGVLRDRDDIFMLTWTEIDELGSGRAMFPYCVTDLVALRRRDHQTLARMAPPDTIELREDAYLPLDFATAALDRNERPDQADAAAQSPILHGTGACGGEVTADAAVLDDVSDAHRLGRGNVLVTRQTDPGWGPVFCLVSGLVIERGGLLSHGAIIAREFGLPCVTGVADATRRIAHGARVTVNGDHGTCVVHHDAGETTGGRR